MIETDWNPDRKKLKQFGFFSLIGFGVIGVVLGFRLGSFEEGKWTFPIIFWSIGVISPILALIQPSLLKPLYWVMTAISAVIGPIIATIIMGLIFLLLFTPLALAFRLAGRDELQRKILPDATTYWGNKPDPQEATRYFRQY